MNTNMTEIQPGHLLQLGGAFPGHAPGTRAVCISEHINIALDTVWVCVLESGEVHAFTIDGVNAFDVQIRGFLPLFRHNDPFSCTCLELPRQAATDASLFDRLFAERQGILAASVRRGAAYLDTRASEWRSRIDRTTLDLRHDERCVMGQLYPGVFDNLERLSAQLDCEKTWDAAIKACQAYGFLLPADGDVSEYDALTDLWRAEVSA